MLCVIYQIRQIETDKRYVGSCKTLFMKRWSQHFQLLERGDHHSKRFQEEWNKTCNIAHWEFRVLHVEEVSTLREVNNIEADFIIQVPEALRLNMPNQTTTTRAKHHRVVEMLKQGKRFIDIRDEVGISLGMISNIKRRFMDNSSMYSL